LLRGYATRNVVQLPDKPVFSFADFDEELEEASRSLQRDFDEADHD
jgi:hypothetical protein